jgi:Tol biopolymer transport system component
MTRRCFVLRLIMVTMAILCLTAVTCSGLETQLTEDPGDCRTPEWGSTGYIVFSSDRMGLNDIWVMDEIGEDLGSSSRTTQSPANTDYEPEWNTTCSHNYFSGSTGGDFRLYYVQWTGSPYTPIPVSLEPGNDRAPDASDAGVVFYSDRAGHNDIMWMPLGSEFVSTYLTTNGADDRWPSWSPGDTLVAFASDRSGNWDIWMMRSSGESAGLWQLTDDAADETWPAFNPGGDLVAFHRDGLGIVAIDVATRLEYQITTNPTDTEPSWSPDGLKIAFSREEAGSWHIWMTDNVPNTPVEELSWGRVKALYR